MTLKRIRASCICIKVKKKICRTPIAGCYCKRSDKSLLAYIHLCLRRRREKQTQASVAQEDRSLRQTRHFWGTETKTEQWKDYYIPFLMEFISSRWWRLPLETPHLWWGFRINQRGCQTSKGRAPSKAGMNTWYIDWLLASEIKGKVGGMGGSWTMMMLRPYCRRLYCVRAASH